MRNVLVIQVFLVVILNFVAINSFRKISHSPNVNLNNHFTRFKTAIFLKPEQLETKNELKLHSTSIKTENDNIKRGKLYLATWFSIYSVCLVCIYYAVDHDLMQAEKYGIEPVKVMNNVCDWLEAHVINVTWITNALRR